MRPAVEDLTSRVASEQRLLEVEAERCEGCGDCVRVCIAGLWGLRDGRAVVAPDHPARCLECAACYQVCERGAIRFRFPPGGTGVVYERG